jgi:hypothetical protein
MANDITGNPWKLDTAAVIQTTPVKVKAMEWRPVTAAGDDLSVTDNAGHEIWTEKALAVDANGQISYVWPCNAGGGNSCNGFEVTTIDSGILRVWL